MTILRNLSLLALLFANLFTSLPTTAQITPAEAGYIDAVEDFGAVNDGVTITTTELQAAMDAAITQGKGLFLPAGEYLVDGTLHIRPPKSDQKFVMQGSSVDPAHRSVIVLKEGTFPNFSSNSKTGLDFVIQNDYGYDDIGTTTTYERVVQSIDIVFQENNAGAVALNYRGAEGTCLFDINMDVTGGYGGIYELPGSGGSIADISIIGGKVGIDLTHDGGTQPTPVITHLKMAGQTESCIKTNSNRGALVISGADITLNPGVSFYHGQRHVAFAFRFGGCPLITDSRFEYTAEAADNVLFSFVSSSNDLSINFSNVYVKNAAAIVSTAFNADVTATANPSGWRHFEQFNYNAGEWVDDGNTYTDGIYLEGALQPGSTYSVSEDVEEADIPANLTSIHGWGETFPSFESEGAVNVLDFAGEVENGDWAPAFNAAILAASQTAENVVFVPTGTYDIYSTIHLGLHTKLVGVSHHHTVILGWDEDGRRFDGSSDAWDDPRPMIETLDDRNADNILADMAVRMVGPFNNKSHNPEPCVHYAILWRAGQESIMRNLNTEPKTSTNYRPVFVMTYELSKSSWITLRAVEGTIQSGGFSITQDNASQFVNHTPVPAGHWLETVNGSKRIMAKSISPFNTHPETEAEDPNISIAKTDQGSFDITSLKVAQASFNPGGGGDIAIACFNGESLVYSDTVLIAGKEQPRDEMVTVELNQSGITSIRITSPVMFSIDDVITGEGTLDFEDITGQTPAVGEGLESALYYDCARDLPLNYLNHHIVRIEGGVKWYNHRKHGDTWMRPTQAYVAVIGNDAPVNFYHFHAQHSQNDQKLYIENARDVTVWGVKTENAGYLAKTINSDNIRFFGHGGLTTPPPGTSHYYFENTTNYSVSAPTDELDREDYCQYCSSGNALLPQSEVGTYTSLQESVDGSILSPDPYHRPIIWERGHPLPAYYLGASAVVEPEVKVVFPLNNAVVESGSEVRITASTITPIDTILKVEFFIDNQGIGFDTVAPYMVDHTFDITGSFLLSAKALTGDSIWITSPGNVIQVSDGFSESVQISIPVLADVSIENNENKWDSENLRSRTTDNSVIYLKFPLDKVFGDVLFADLSMYSWAAVEAHSVRLVANDSWIDSLVHINEGPGRVILAPEEPALGAITATGAGIIHYNLTSTASEENKGITDSGNDTISLQIRNEMNTSFTKYSSSESTATAGRDYPPTLTVSSTLAKAPGLEITAPADASEFTVEDQVVVSLLVTEQYQEITKIEFYLDGGLVGEATTAPYTYTIENLEPGTHIISAVSHDIAGTSGAASPVSIHVTGSTANESPVVSLTSPASQTTYHEGETIGLAADASDPDGNIVAVKFYYNNKLIGTDDRAPYEMNWYLVPAGIHHVTARAYDDQGTASTSASIEITVIQAPEIEITSPLPEGIYLVGSSMEISASAFSSTGDIVEVRFYTEGQLIIADSESPFTASYTPTAAGSLTITAEVEDEYGQVISDMVTITVRTPRGPYGGTAAELPGYLNMEEFDEGGNGIAYQDDNLREGGSPWFRPAETVDIRSNANPLYTGDSLAVGNVVAGEWLEFTVNVISSGTYQFTIEAAGPRPAGEPAGGTYARGYASLSVDGDSLGAVMITNTSDDEYGPAAWHAWQGFHIDGIKLDQGAHIVRWTAHGSYNINRMSFLDANEAPSVSIITPEDGATIVKRDDVVITFEASDDGEIAQVEIYADEQLIRTITDGAQAFIWTGADLGNHEIYLVAYDDQGVSTQSETVSFEVVESNSMDLINVLKLLSPYPNPCTESFRLDVPSGVQGLQLELLDLSGRTILSKNRYVGGSVDITTLDAGMYLIRLKAHGVTVETKLVIE